MKKEAVVDTQFEDLKSFRDFLKAADEGVPIPSVSAGAIRTLHEVSMDMTKRYCGKDGVVGVNMMARSLSREANIPAVWFRYTRLRMFAREGLLEEWRHNSSFEELVYRVTASIPMSGRYVDREAFLDQLRVEAAAA
jgi:hypothetical protein